METKLCRTCNTVLSLDNFWKMKRVGRDGYQSKCKDCQRKYRQDNIEARNNYAVEWRMARFGISLSEYNELMVIQNKKCAICGITEDVLERRFAVDHDHKTGKVRGLLCFGCNTTLGKFKDSVDLLKKAVEYLERQ